MSAQFPLDLGIPTRHVVMYSGGAGAWETARRVIDRHGPSHVTLLQTDTLAESSDTYRFMVESACQLFGIQVPADWMAAVRRLPEWHEDRFGRRVILDDLRACASVFVPQLVWIADGRDPWEVYHDERMLGKSGMANCSKILKREKASRWLAANCHRENTVIYLGLDWSEEHRFDDGKGGGAKHRYARGGWTAEAPLCEPPYISLDKIARIRAAGLEPAQGYLKGYAHDNCSGGCCQAGQGHYAHRLEVDPERFAFDEANEQEFIEFIGKDVSMLTEQRNKVKYTLTLRELRERIQGKVPGDVDRHEIGGCGCFVDNLDEAA
jgi:hypothetical protein